MKKMIVALFLVTAASLSTNARAEIYYAPNYTCSELQQIVATNGVAQIQMRFGYAVYVNNPQLCGNDSVGGGTVYGTKDQGSCNVGYSCHENNGGGGNG